MKSKNVVFVEANRAELLEEPIEQAEAAQQLLYDGKNIGKVVLNRVNPRYEGRFCCMKSIREWTGFCDTPSVPLPGNNSHYYQTYDMSVTW